MTLNIEITKNGKPHIVHDNYKYRESYVLKNGDFVWRCLGKNCTASIKTNQEKTMVISTNNVKHSGPHPSTMRALLSPRPTCSTPVKATAGENVSSAATTPHQSSTTEGQSPSSDRSTAASPIVEAQSATPHAATTSISDQLVAENTKLKESLTELSSQYKLVLDHSIESDMRLMRYTDKVFVANSLQATASSCVPVADSAVQCELLPVGGRCLNTQCQHTRDLVTNLRTTIEVLEAEVRCLKGELIARRGQEEEHNNEGWVLCKNYKKPVDTSNRFVVLRNEEGEDDAKNDFKKSTFCIKKKKNDPNDYKNKQRINTNKSNKEKLLVGRKPNRQKVTVPFKNVIIEGDSHARHLSKLLRECIAPNTSVTGICKPNAKLQSVLSGCPSLPDGSCSIILAGTNDIASGEAQNIYRDLEQRINSRTSKGKVIVATLPYRFDLPAHHPVNQQTGIVNNFIEELCVRLRVGILCFNSIPRRLFTRHGLHLRPPGKRLLAGLIVECLVNTHRLDVPGSPHIGTEAVEQSSQREACLTPETDGQVSRPITSEPITLPFDTYADAVRTPASSGTHVTQVPASNVTGAICSLSQQTSKNCFLLRKTALT